MLGKKGCLNACLTYTHLVMFTKLTLTKKEVDTMMHPYAWKKYRLSTCTGLSPAVFLEEMPFNSVIGISTSAAGAASALRSSGLAQLRIPVAMGVAKGVAMGVDRPGSVFPNGVCGGEKPP